MEIQSYELHTLVGLLALGLAVFVYMKVTDRQVDRPERIYPAE